MTWQISVSNDDTTTAIHEPADIEARALLVCAHGAGGSMNDRGMLAMTRALRAHGIDIVRFNFLYKEHGSGRPDPMPRLERCFEAVVEHVQRELAPPRLFIGGRSMGGRAASMMAANDFDCAGLILYAYPLHPAGQPEKLRVAHLPSITVPVLCINGTRDALCTPALMNDAVSTVVAPFTMHWIEGADHSFHVLKSSGRNDADVLDEIGRTTAAWV